MKTIQGKILTVITLGFLILGTALCSVSIFVTKDILHSDAETILSTRAREEAAYINELLDRIEESVYILETYAEQELESVKRLSKDLEYREDYTKLAGEIFYNVARNTDGVEAFYLRYSPELTRGDAGFFVIYNHDGSYESVPPTNINDYAKDDTEHVGWYYEPIDAGKAIWMKPYYNQNIGVKMISFAAPLYFYNENGEAEFFGVCGMDVNFSHFTSVIDELTIYDNGYAFLTDENGTIIHHPNREGKNPIDRVDRIEATAPLKNGMNLVIRADHSDVEKNTDKIVMMFIVITAAVLLIFVIIMIVLVRRMIKPLKQLTYAAEELASGNTDIVCDCETNDEIGRLSAVFNDTAAKLKEYMTYINSLAYRDSLTGVKNRTAFIEAAAEMNKKVRTHNAEFGVIMADINGLKRANDLYGHEVGNQLIVESTKILCTVFKHSPVFRIGGDEFAVILENSDYKNHRALLHALDAEYQKAFVNLENDRLPVMVAHGVALFTFGLDRNFDDVMNRADQQMYISKREFKRKNGQ